MSRPYLAVCLQRHPMDCAVATMAMLLGKSYEDVLQAFKHNVMAKGATVAQMQAAARRLGTALRWRRWRDALEHETGILAVSSPRWAHDHLVLLKDGELIIDTDGTIWETDVFLSAYEARPVSLLVEQD